MADNDKVVEVKHDADSADFVQEQNEALMHYRLTGEAGKYVDPTRDQEPDIAPELGVAPHPDLANPAPPASSFSGRALDPNAVPMVQSAEEKEEQRADATEAFNKVVQEREEAFNAGALSGTTGPAPVRVVVVDEDDEPKAGLPSLPADESVKTVEGDSSAQLPQDLEAAGVVDSGDSDESDKDE